jgi:hypothetical protein
LLAAYAKRASGPAARDATATRPAPAKPLPTSTPEDVYATLAAASAARLAAAQRQMATQGIPDAQRAAGYTPRVSDALAYDVTPSMYEGQALPLLRAVGHMVTGVPAHAPPVREAGWGSTISPAARDASEDAWRLYLGLPQTHGQLGVSDYRPSKSTDEGPYYRLTDFVRTQLGDTPAAQQAGIARVLRDIAAARANPRGVVPRTDGQEESAPGDYNYALGRFKYDAGQDEHGPYLSYYDRYDFDKAPGAGAVGHPYEVYDRIYYDPKTLRPLDPQPAPVAARRR